MQVGLVLMGHHGSWDDAAYAEANGFATVGFVDSPLIAADPFVAMALTAERTSTLRVGITLGVPGTRNAASLVTAVATVNRLAPGRAFLGLGTGNTSRAVFGLKAVPVDRFSDYVTACRALLNGQEIAHHESNKTRHVRLRHGFPDRYVHPENIPVYVAADGPRALHTAGTHGDGWITSLQGANWLINAPEVFSASLNTVRRAAAEAGREPDNLYTMVAASVCVLEDGESPTAPRVLERVGAVAMLPFHAYADNPAIANYLPQVVQDRLEIYEREVLARFDVPRDRLYQETHRGHLSHLLPGETEVLTDEIIRTLTMTGSAREIADLLGRLETSGVRNVMLHPPPHLVHEQVREWATKIAPLLDSDVEAPGPREPYVYVEREDQPRPTVQ
jgi:alkanesulfonate monooxygenase SsuD/methylene tetrahydromethanopterin reductase-like flavin-dependent oxidoreductase (luciferase family)